MTTEAWYRVGAFHVLPESMVQAAYPYIEALHVRDAELIATQHLVLGAPGLMSRQAHTVLVEVSGLCIEVHAGQVHAIARLLPHLPALPGVLPEVYVLAGENRVLYMASSHRAQFEYGLREMDGGPRAVGVLEAGNVRRPVSEPGGRCDDARLH